MKEPDPYTRHFPLSIIVQTLFMVGRISAENREVLEFIMNFKLHTLKDRRKAGEVINWMCPTWLSELKSVMEEMKRVSNKRFGFQVNSHLYKHHFNTTMAITQLHASKCLNRVGFDFANVHTYFGNKRPRKQLIPLPKPATHAKNPRKTKKTIPLSDLVSGV